MAATTLVLNNDVIFTPSITGSREMSAPCLEKKRANFWFCSVSVNYKPTSIKINRHVLEETPNKTVQIVHFT